MHRCTRAPTLLFATALAGCASSPAPGDDTAGLAQFFEQSLAARAEPVVRYAIAGATYYYVESPCCDLYNPVYDARGKFVCAPDGGFTGRGDGRCPADVRRPAEGEAVPNPFYRR